MSVAIATCIPKHKDPLCVISAGDEVDLVKKMLEYLKHLSYTANLILKEKLQYVFDTLETSENCRKEKVAKKLDATLKSYSF